MHSGGTVESDDRKISGWQELVATQKVAERTASLRKS